MKHHPEITLKELALMLNFTQNALVELLIEKGIITEKEINERTQKEAMKHKLRRRKNQWNLITNTKRIGKIYQGRKRRYVLGDKGKKDKDKSRKQNINKQEQKAKRKLEKQPKRTP